MTVPRPLAWSLWLIPWLLVIAAAGWLVLQRFPPSGVVTFKFTMDGSSPWLDTFLPAQRVTAPGPQPDGWVGQRLFDQPVYASARSPGPYEQVTWTLEGRVIRQPLIELGILRDSANFGFETFPVWSEALSKGWHRVTSGMDTGFVRDGLPDSTLTTADAEHVIVWDATATTPLLMDPAGTETTYNYSLRGSHDFYVVPANGYIVFRLLLQDMNRSRSGNIAVFRLSNEDETIATDAIGTSGSQEKKPGVPFEKNLLFHGLKPGVYRLSFQADDDLFIRRITTTAQHWVIGPRLVFGDTYGYAGISSPAVTWTNSRHMAVETFHIEGLQTVSLGSAKTTLMKTHTSYGLDRLPTEMAGPRPFTAPNGDVRLVGDGYFALSPSALFLPKPRRMTDASHPLEEGIDVIKTPYVQPEITSDGWMRWRATFGLGGSTDGQKFTLSAPGILVRNGAVDVRSAELEYRRPALSWSEWGRELRRELVAAWHRL